MINYAFVVCMYIYIYTHTYDHIVCGYVYPMTNQQLRHRFPASDCTRPAAPGAPHPQRQRLTP